MGCGCGCHGAKKGCQGEGSQTFEQARRVEAAIRHWYAGRSGISSIRVQWLKKTTNFVVVVRYCDPAAIFDIPEEVQGVRILRVFVNPAVWALTNGMR